MNITTNSMKACTPVSETNFNMMKIRKTTEKNREVRSRTNICVTKKIVSKTRKYYQEINLMGLNRDSKPQSLSA